MRFIGCLLMLSGWLIVIAALDMLTAYQQRVAFVLAGLAVEGLGLGLLTYGYASIQRRSR